MPPPSEWHKNFSQITLEKEVGTEIGGGQLCKVDMVNPTDDWKWLWGSIMDTDTGEEVTKNPIIGQHFVAPHTFVTVDFPPWPGVLTMPDKDWSLRLNVNEWWLF